MISQFSSKYRWLSNFVPCSIMYKGTMYASVEHAYQSVKSDSAVWKAFCASDVPANVIKMVTSAIHKKGLYPERLGKLIEKHNLDPDLQLVKFIGYFHRIKLNLMRELVTQKFTSEKFSKMLIATGDNNIQEGNYWGDDYWGIDLKTGKGENHLGRIIMSIRARLLSNKEPHELTDWVVTDPDCGQRYKQVSKTVYTFEEQRVADRITGETTTYTADIDLLEYTPEEMWRFVEGYGYTKKEFIGWLLGIEDWGHSLIAECIFESND